MWIDPLVLEGLKCTCFYMQELTLAHEVRLENMHAW